jgi:hypothetical protein
MFKLINILNVLNTGTYITIAQPPVCWKYSRNTTFACTVCVCVCVRHIAIKQYSATNNMHTIL